MMNRKTPITTASCLLGGSTFLIGAMIYLAFLFPKTARVWDEQGQQLSAPQMLMVNVSNLAKSFGFPILCLLMLLLVASLILLAVSIEANRKESANKQIQSIAGKPGSV